MFRANAQGARSRDRDGLLLALHVRRIRPTLRLGTAAQRPERIRRRGACRSRSRGPRFLVFWSAGRHTAQQLALQRAHAQRARLRFASALHARALEFSTALRSMAAPTPARRSPSLGYRRPPGALHVTASRGALSAARRPRRLRRRDESKNRVQPHCGRLLRFRSSGRRRAAAARRPSAGSLRRPRRLLPGASLAAPSDRPRDRLPEDGPRRLRCFPRPRPLLLD